MARRFIIKEEDIKTIDNQQIEIYGEEVKHIQVLRKNIGDSVIINDKIFEIEKIYRDSIVLNYINKAPMIGIPQNRVTLYIALLKTDKLDFVVQKAVEIGVKRIIPFTSTNVIVKLDDKGKQKRKEKLQKIADEACKQCGRMDSVNVEDFISFSTLKDKVLNEEKVLFAYESSKDSLRKQIIKMKEEGDKNIGVIIGAEGGFTTKEADELKLIENVEPVSLGTRILRAETAALNLLSIIMYEMEE